MLSEQNTDGCITLIIRILFLTAWRSLFLINPHSVATFLFGKIRFLSSSLVFEGFMGNTVYRTFKHSPEGAILGKKGL